MPAFAPSRTPDHGYPLLRWFSLVSLLALGAASVVSAVLMSRFLEAQLLRHDAELSRDFVQSIVSTQAVEDAFRAAPGKDPPAAFAEFLKHVAAMPDVLRTNVYGMDRRMLWSSDPALIGRRFEHNEELDRALAGELAIERGTVSGAEPLAKPEHVHLRGSGFVENYLPIVDASRGHQQIGVVELYRVPRGLNAILRESTLMVWGVTLAGGLALYFSTLGVVRRASALMREQHARLAGNEALAVIGEIAAATAHSIRNPLASIRSTAELQRELGHMTPEAADVAHGVLGRLRRHAASGSSPESRAQVPVRPGERGAARPRARRSTGARSGLVPHRGE